MNCLKCGFVLGDNDRFCMRCGTPAGQSGVQGVPFAGPQVQQAAPDNAQPPLPQELPYAPPVMQGTNIIIPQGRSYRIRCPDCGLIIDNVKSDATAAFPCPACKKAYAYGGQLLIYRMGSFHPLIMAVPYQVIIDGIEYGELRNHSSVRIMLPSGTHTVCCGHLKTRKLTNTFQITVSPQYYNFAFKFNIIYRPYGRPGDKGFPIEFNPCLPEQIPYV